MLSLIGGVIKAGICAHIASAGTQTMLLASDTRLFIFSNPDCMCQLICWLGLSWGATMHSAGHSINTGTLMCLRKGRLKFGLAFKISSINEARRT
jgi:hypothetical protein